MLVQEFFNLEFQTGLSTGGVVSPRRFRVQEETVTESVLLKLEAAFPDIVAVETYDRARERRTGADWFWIFDFRGTLVPVLVQAKKILGPWDGSDDWNVAFNPGQGRRLRNTAADWNVGAHYCLYAPRLNGWRQAPWPCEFPWMRSGFMHLLNPAAANQRQMSHSNLNEQLLPLTCWCCCSANAEDATRVLDISREKFREGDQAVAELLGLARETETVKGSVVLKMKGERNG